MTFDFDDSALPLAEVVTSVDPKPLKAKSRQSNRWPLLIATTTLSMLAMLGGIAVAWGVLANLPTSLGDASEDEAALLAYEDSPQDSSGDSQRQSQSARSAIMQESSQPESRELEPESEGDSESDAAPADSQSGTNSNSNRSAPNTSASDEASSTDSEQESLWLTAEELRGPFKLSDPTPLKYIYRISIGQPDELVHRYAELMLHPPDADALAEQTELMKETISNFESLPLELLRYTDKQVYGYEPPYERTLLNEAYAQGYALVSESGRAWPYTGQNYLDHLLDSPVQFAFAPIKDDPSQDSWVEEDSFPVVVQTVAGPAPLSASEAGHLRARRLINPFYGVEPPTPQVTLDEMTVMGERKDSFTVVSRSDQSLLVRVKRAVRSSNRGLANFDLDGEEIISFDRTLGRVTYRRFVGYVSGTGPSSRKPVVYEMFLTTTTPEVRLGVHAAMGFEFRSDKSIERVTGLPITSAQLINTRNFPGQYTLSPDGKWLTEHQGFGIRLHSLIPNHEGLIFVTGPSNSTAFWDHDSEGFAHAVPHRLLGRHGEGIDVFTIDQKYAWGHFQSGLDTLPRSEPIQSLALNVTNDQVVATGLTEVRSFSVRSGEKRWRQSVGFRWQPFDMAWIGSQFFIDGADSLNAFNSSTGNRRRVVAWASEEGVSPQAFKESIAFRSIQRSGTLWKPTDTGLLAVDINTGEHLGTIPELAGLSAFSVAEDAQLIFALKGRHLLVYSTIDLSLVGDSNLVSLMRSPANISVTRDGRKALILPQATHQSPVLLEFDL